MTLPIIKLKTEDEIFSPFSGRPASKEGEIADDDSTLLFLYFGEVGEYAYVSDKFRSSLPASPSSFDNVESVCEKSSLENGVVFEVDAEWNGVNYYGFAPS